MVDEGLAEEGGGNAARPALEELNPENLLHLPQPARNGWLRQVEMLGGSQDAALLGNGRYEHQVPEL